jgi:hypothetical protein
VGLKTNGGSADEVKIQYNKLIGFLLNSRATGIVRRGLVCGLYDRNRREDNDPAGNDHFPHAVIPQA